MNYLLNSKILICFLLAFKTADQNLNRKFNFQISVKTKLSRFCVHLQIYLIIDIIINNLFVAEEHSSLGIKI